MASAPMQSPRTARSFDESVYKLTVPTDDEEVLAQTFQILEDRKTRKPWNENPRAIDL